ncbi:hypothetical protein ACSSS7_005334 [Eimeria intestinalis]
MKCSAERSLGSGALVTLTAFLSSIQQGLLWLACLFGGFFIHVLWFWRRVLLRTTPTTTSSSGSSSSSSSSSKGGKRQRRKGKKLSSSRVHRGQTADGKVPAGSAAAAAATAAVAAPQRDTLGSSGVRRRQQQEDPRSSSGSSSSRNSNNASSSSMQESEDSEAWPRLAPVTAAADRGGDTTLGRGGDKGDRGRDTGGVGDLWDAGIVDSADEADSEVEQDRLLPAAEQRQRLPRQSRVPGLCYSSKLRGLGFSSVPILSRFYPRWREVSVHPASHVRRLRVSDALELHLCVEWIMAEPCAAAAAAAAPAAAAAAAAAGGEGGCCGVVGLIAI